jgi:hypothetical protein
VKLHKSEVYVGLLLGMGEPWDLSSDTRSGGLPRPNTSIFLNQSRSVSSYEPK